MSVETSTALQVQAGEDFVLTPAIEATCTRALAYLEAGYAVRLSGPAGTGKTTLALHLAALRTRPVALIYGDEEFGTSNLLGSEKGMLSRKVVDNFIRTVHKSEESVRSVWVDQRLTTACRDGHTLVYDEFSRSRPEANNVLLSVLEEGLIILPDGLGQEGYLRVHPDFRAIFTSNPNEYVGVYKTQDALLDRMITIELGPYDEETEVAITQAQSGIPVHEAATIVQLVRDFRERERTQFRPSLRACIMIAKVTQSCGGRVRADNPLFRETCLDILRANATKMTPRKIQRLIQTHTEQPGERRHRNGHKKGNPAHPHGNQEPAYNEKSNGQIPDQDTPRSFGRNGQAQPGKEDVPRGNGALGAEDSAAPAALG